MQPPLQIPPPTHTKPNPSNPTRHPTPPRARPPQLGNGSTCYTTIPEKVVDLDGIPIADIAAGGWHSLALTSDGQIYVWGRGEYGRLGVGDRTGSSKLRPTFVKGLEPHTIVQVRAWAWFGLGWGLERAAEARRSNVTRDRDSPPQPNPPTLHKQ